MRRSARPLVLVAGAVAAGLASGLLLVGGDDDPRAGSAPENALSVVTRIEPRAPAFGDPVHATVVVIVDANVIDRRSVRVDAEFEPYELLGEAEAEISGAGSLARLSFRYALVCVAEACTPGDSPAVEFPLGRVLYRYRGQSGRAAREIDWAPFAVAERVTEQDLDAYRWRGDVSLLPAASYRIDPRSLALALLAAALAVVVAIAALAWRFVGRRRAVEPEVAVDTRSALERALDGAVTASRNGDVPARRAALEGVARELLDVDRRDLADRARMLAWSSQAPSAGAVEQLVRDVRPARGVGPHGEGEAA